MSNKCSIMDNHETYVFFPGTVKQPLLWGNAGA
jgi:hypothetical protein